VCCGLLLLLLLYTIVLDIVGRIDIRFRACKIAFLVSWCCASINIVFWSVSCVTFVDLIEGPFGFKYCG